MISHKSKKRIPFGSSKNIQNAQSTTKKVYQFVHSSAVDPHPDKVQKGGQDAVYVSNNIIVVADGVGGWKNYGVDAGEYSKNLIQIIANITQDHQKRLYYIQNPQKLACACVNLNKMPGSTTLTIVTLHPKNGLLRTYCIGDSVYGIFKHKQEQPIIGKQQQYCFNHPYQVGSNFTNKQSQQQMQFCDPSLGLYNQFSFPQIQNSHLVVASDGIWDNLFIRQISNIIEQGKQLKHQTNQNIADIQKMDFIVSKLLKSTKNTYQFKNYQSPFYIKGKQMGLDVGKMAKIDDLSIVIAKVIIREIQTK